jgi:hypothetical protein
MGRRSEAKQAASVHPHVIKPLKTDPSNAAVTVQPRRRVGRRGPAV